MTGLSSSSIVSDPQMHVFEDVYYFLAPSLSAQRRQELATVLDANGATPVDLDQATHVITNSNNFEGRQLVGEDAAVVSDYWVDRSMVLAKKQPPSWYSADAAMIFSGVVACSADLGDSDTEILMAGITALGGQWRAGLTRDVTHLFALTPDSVRYETAMHHRGATRMKILLPHWFDDAVKLGYRGLPTTEYEWPEPAMFRKEGEKGMRKSSVPGEKKALYESAVAETDQQTRGSSQNVWGGRKVLLGVTTKLKDGRREAIEAGIARAGGIVVQSHDRNGDEEEEAEKIEDADVYITRYRAGAAYYRALKSGKTIGTLSWLFHVHSTGVLAAPSDQLLHFPIPKDPIPGFSSHIITITNYTGEARDYIRKLIMTMGGSFTPSMSNANTVVIAAYIGGNKVDKAYNWNIPVVNHTWLEDCFVQWRNLTVGLEKYISFPPGVDFSTVLGEKEIGRAVLELELERALDAGEIEEPSGRKSQVNKTELQAPTSTVGSVYDMMEVEDVILMDDPASVPVIDVDIDAGIADRNLTDIVTKPRTPRKPRAEAASIDSDFVDEEKDADVHVIEASPRRSRRIAKSLSPVKKPFSIAELSHPETSDAEAEGGEKVNEVPDSRGRRPRTMAKPVSEIVIPIKTSPKKKPRPATPSSDEHDNAPGPSKHRQAVQALVLDDSESDEDMPDVSTLLRERPSSPSKSRGKGKASSPSATLPSLLKGKTTLESVEIPLLPKKKSVAASTYSPTRGRGRAMKGDATHLEAKEVPDRSSRKEKSMPAIRSSSLTPVTSSRLQSDEHADGMETPNNARAKRSAALKANQMLHDHVMPDMLKWEKNEKHWNVRGPWEKEFKEKELQNGKKRVSTGGDDNSSRRKRSRKSDENQTPVDGVGEDSDQETVTISKSKQGPKANKRASNVGAASHKGIRLLTTQVKLGDQIVESLKEMGVKFVSKVADCTHLVVKGLVRTEKLLCAIPQAPFVMNSEWAIDSVNAGKLLPVEKYLLLDEEGEARYDFKFSEALQRATLLKEQRKGLLSGKTFHITPAIQKNRELYQAVIKANGGEVAKNNRPTVRLLNGQHNSHYVISCEEDGSIWEPLVDNGVTVYDTEWLLLCALKQTLDIADTKYRLQKAAVS
ncbi:hypothetical protein OE88DRAFT_1685439 [Heliocybe sulcata]|uniref:BRCT domain-containing protein n=1 Tax=Heliocybe sulcata TaxID=5364 RepID=A0A5C3MUF4_9AGAM|nr:hypothetical protein OE88DRAFT_1685439 [Heliocybe sulcata]